LDVLEEEMGWQFELHNFNDRLRLQKFVFLAPAFGFDHPYSYGMHLRGPYSPPLAQDYYSDLTAIEPNEDAIQTFNVDRFVQLVENRDTRWLEVAATLRAYVIRLQNKGIHEDIVERAIEKTMEEKDETRSFVEQVFADMKQGNAFPE